MFTGIIEEIGTIRSIRQGSSSASITIEAKKFFAIQRLVTALR